MDSDSSSGDAERRSAPVVVIERAPPSLDSQILQAENAVAQRDRRVRDSLLAVGTQAKAAGTRAAVGIAVAGGALAVAWLLTRHRVGPAASMAPKVRRRASLAVVRAAALLWPLLPLSVKSRASNLLVRSVLKAGNPLLTRIAKRERAVDDRRQPR